MKKINCSSCFRNFMQVLNKLTCPYCGKEATNEEFVKCKPIEVLDFDIKDLKDDLYDTEELEIDDAIDVEIENDTEDEIQPEIDDDSEDEHNEDSEIAETT